MRHKPTETYSGLTVVIDTPSRFDRHVLMSGYAGAFFDSTLGVSRDSCDLRTLSTLNAGFLSNTRVVLLLGRKSLQQYKPGIGLDEQRGNPWMEGDVIHMASYMPQDAFDRKNYFNPNTEYTVGSDDDKVMHGKISEIFHNETGLFRGLESPFHATRYHSLIIEENTLAKEFHINAWTENKTIMAIQHEQLPVAGLQFHPESIATEQGMAILKNFLKT